MKNKNKMRRKAKMRKVKKIRYFNYDNPNPFITEEIKQMAALITPQHIENEYSIFDLLREIEDAKSKKSVEADKPVANTPATVEEYEEDYMPTLEEMRAAWSIAPKNVRDYFAS